MEGWNFYRKEGNVADTVYGPVSIICKNAEAYHVNMYLLLYLSIRVRYDQGYHHFYVWIR